MSAFNQMSVATKIMSALGLFTALTGGVAAYGLYNVSAMSGLAQDLANDEAESLRIAGAASEHMSRIQQLWLESAVTVDEAATRALKQETDAETKALDESLAALKPFFEDEPADLARLEKTTSAFAEYKETVAPAFAMSLRNDVAGVSAILTKQATPKYDIVDQNLDAIVDSQDKEMEAAAADAKARASTASWMMIGATLLGLLVIGGIALQIVRRQVTGPIALITEVMRRLAGGETRLEIPAADRADEIGAMAKAVLVFRDAAVAQEEAAEQKELADAAQQTVVRDLGSALAKLSAGDLTVALRNFPGDYRKLEEDFNAAIGELRDAMGKIAQATGNIHGGSGEISQASDDLSHRTEQQAASLEETAAAMTQITTTVHNSATGANEANKLVRATQADAQESSKVVGDAVAAMAEIEKSSQEITKIIEVIDKIAFQTNLLALNASVEAAHAGEAGRAFAVVANEVRALAQRSADAAQEIGTLISNSSRQVEGGVALVGEAGKALGRIIGSVDEVSGLVSQIAMAADQQSSALAQVNTAITEMDKVTQQNAAMVEESTAAAKTLADEADGLSRLVGRFDTGTAKPSAAPAPRRAATSRPAARPATRGNNALALQSNLAAAVDDWNEF
ncbi:methyl-accepting chemotaxis protein [Sphingosinicella sp. BN140058]|uniref:methyl-accepting chemotaxis protein n=1 Tax=Sphingosinicella sp. BN140058 TaxID=1892855 RepID=UPI0013EDE122|nr:methyl-accepting chemotaxis protein [Sphingosinicella sp. BN140058]